MWKSINQTYSISDDGLVRNDKTSRILKSYFCGDYLYVRLGKGKKYKIHRLVAEAFCENVDNKPLVDHINRIKTDNRSINLRWVDYSENGKNRTPERKPRLTNKLQEYGISMSRQYYIVKIDKTYRGHFSTLEEAIKCRDMVVKNAV